MATPRLSGHGLLRRRATRPEPRSARERAMGREREGWGSSRPALPPPPSFVSLPFSLSLPSPSLRTGTSPPA